MSNAIGQIELNVETGHSVIPMMRTAMKTIRPHIHLILVMPSIVTMEMDFILKANVNNAFANASVQHITKSVVLLVWFSTQLSINAIIQAMLDAKFALITYFKDNVLIDSM